MRYADPKNYSRFHRRITVAAAMNRWNAALVGTPAPGRLVVGKSRRHPGNAGFHKGPARAF